MTTPTPAPAPMTARLRELMEEATPGEWEWQNGCSWWRLGTRAGNGNVICPTTHPIDRHPDLIVSREDRELIVYLKNNTPTILRLLEAVEGAEKALTDIKEWKLPPSNCYWDKDRTDPMSYETAFGSNGARNHIRGVATSALATLRAAREGAR